MDATHLHLALTHFPILGVVIGIGILFYGLFIKKTEIQKVALALFIAMAIMTIPVYVTGEEAEETVEHIAGVSEQLIENHEELAEVAIWLMAALAGISIFNLLALVTEMALAKTVTMITLVVSLATFGLFAQVGNLGGQIRHSEIRANNSGQVEGYNSHENEHDHDDDD